MVAFRGASSHPESVSLSQQVRINTVNLTIYYWPANAGVYGGFLGDVRLIEAGNQDVASGSPFMSRSTS
jgi:hypothetical protein